MVNQSHHHLQEKQWRVNRKSTNISGRLFLRVIGCRVFKALPISEWILTCHPVFVDLDLAHTASLEYLRSHISKSVPSYLGRSFRPTKYEIATEFK